MDAVVLLPGQGERIEAGASTAVMKATGEMTGGAFSISEVTFPAGMKGPPPHRHDHTTDTFYILEGTLHVRVGEREVDAPVRFLNINAPGGWENYLRDLAGAMRSGTMPGTAEFARLVAKYDFVVPP